MSTSEDIGKLLPISDIYKDIAQPTARQIGGALEYTAKVARLLLAPIEYLAAYGEGCNVLGASSPTCSRG